MIMSSLNDPERRNGRYFALWWWCTHSCDEGDQVTYRSEYVLKKTSTNRVTGHCKWHSTTVTFIVVIWWVLVQWAGDSDNKCWRKIKIDNMLLAAVMTQPTPLLAVGTGVKWPAVVLDRLQSECDEHLNKYVAPSVDQSGLLNGQTVHSPRGGYRGACWGV